MTLSSRVPIPYCAETQETGVEGCVRRPGWENWCVGGAVWGWEGKTSSLDCPGRREAGATAICVRCVHRCSARCRGYCVQCFAFFQVCFASGCVRIFAPQNFLSRADTAPQASRSRSWAATCRRVSSSPQVVSTRDDGGRAPAVRRGGRSALRRRAAAKRPPTAAARPAQRQPATTGGADTLALCWWV